MNREPRLCGIEGCDGQHFAKGRCKEHYDKMNEYDHILRKPLKSDNLAPCGLTPSQEANLCAFVRNLKLGA